MKYLPYFLVCFAILFNLYTLSPELKVKADPNDNIFHYALIYKANEIINSIAAGQKPPSALFDHWVSYWASGYPLPFYYQHFPHLFVVSIYKLIFQSISLYNIFNFIKWLLWGIFPLSLYCGGRWLGLSKIAAAFSAFFGSQLLTDGLYGADISSFAWRGYGLYTQLWALIFAPLAFGKIYKAVKNKNKSDLILSIIFLSAAFASHLAIGYIVAVSSLFIPLSFLEIETIKLQLKQKKREKISIKNLKNLLLTLNIQDLILILGSSFLLLSYWFIPLLKNNLYHNVSFWDPPLKWDSYGAKEVLSMLAGGALFDFGRPPIITILTIIGLLVCLYRFKEQYRLLAMLFPFWLLLYFGRPFWGNLINLLPMMKEMHLQRLINALHLFSFPLIGIGCEFLVKNGRDKLQNAKLKFKNKSLPFFDFGFLILLLVFGFLVYKANYNYLKLNQIWLKEANLLYAQNENYFKALLDKLKSLPPGRIHAGRPGNWGKNFKIGATQVYLALSTQGFDINGFLPESWSLNTDLETFFDENNPEHYQFFNVRYLITPSDFKTPKFLKEIGTYGPFKLSSAETTGFFDIGVSNLLARSEKENFLNFARLWFSSDLPSKKEFPTLLLSKKSPALPYTTQIDLIGTNLYKRDEKISTIYSLSYNLKPEPELLGKILKEKIENEKYSAKVEINKDCQNCLVIFKMTYHPNWQAKIDGSLTDKIMVLPSFMAIKIPPGIHEVEFVYQPDKFKLPLLVFGAFFAGLLGILKKIDKINNND